jgi:hypothetical protein
MLIFSLSVWYLLFPLNFVYGIYFGIEVIHFM